MGPGESGARAALPVIQAPDAGQGSATELVLATSMKTRRASCSTVAVEVRKPVIAQYRSSGGKEITKTQT